MDVSIIEGFAKIPGLWETLRSGVEARVEPHENRGEFPFFVRQWTRDIGFGDFGPYLVTDIGLWRSPGRVSSEI
jgi:hypothetical protein